MTSILYSNNDFRYMHCNLMLQAIQFTRTIIVRSITPLKSILFGITNVADSLENIIKKSVHVQ